MPQCLVEDSILETKTYLSSESAGLCGARVDDFIERPFTVLFEEQVRRDPEKVAVTCGEATLTFGELNKRRITCQHLQHSVGGESLVGIASIVRWRCDASWVFLIGGAYCLSIRITGRTATLWSRTQAAGHRNKAKLAALIRAEHRDSFA